MGRRRLVTSAALLGAIALGLTGCMETVKQTDRDVGALIRARQKSVLHATSDARIGRPERLPLPGRAAYEKNPARVPAEIPIEFQIPASQPTSAPAAEAGGDAGHDAGAEGGSGAAGAAATQPAGRETVFTLTDALGYAQENERAYQTAKEELYLAALALTLERHLWTPIFSSSLRTVYGNYGENQNFDQAMRFVADLGVSQRLPYGGGFTASAVSTLIRDVKKSITASETGGAVLGLKVPFLRGAGHVAQERLIQLERELTYAVRIFERYRREQLVRVAQNYFDLLRAKQQVIDAVTSYERAIVDYERARAVESTGEGTLLDTQRAEQQMLGAENSLQTVKESFRTQADEFKVSIGMPIDAPLGLDDLETIESIEAGIVEGRYPLLLEPVAAHDSLLATTVALERRFDVLTTRDRIDDARRGVAISRNALLPDLNWESTLTLPTDETRYSVAQYSFGRANWRSEVLLKLPLERTAERNAFRASLIAVRAAERALVDQEERVRLEVRAVINRLRLQARLLEIQEQNVTLADRRREFADHEFQEGRISNRDKLEAEQEWTAARNGLNQAKTARWNLLLQFRLATETLEIAENGEQERAIAEGE